MANPVREPAWLAYHLVPAEEWLLDNFHLVAVQLREIVQHLPRGYIAELPVLAEGPHAGRVFGFYLEHGEWFNEKGRGYDRSEANTQGFRAWLRARYKNTLVALREQARAGRDFATADALRDAFSKAGIAVEDTPDGPRWRLS